VSLVVAMGALASQGHREFTSRLYGRSTFGTWRSSWTRCNANGGRIFSAARIQWDGALGRWRVGLPRDEIVTLANGLVALANQRNPLTHRVAGQREVMAPVRSLALECARVVVRLGLPGAIVG
jgi:hypothetical protein